MSRRNVYNFGIPIFNHNGLRLPSDSERLGSPVVQACLILENHEPPDVLVSFLSSDSAVPSVLQSSACCSFDRLLT